MPIELSKIPDVYRELLQAFPVIDPQRSPGSGLAVQTLYAYYRDQHKENPAEQFPISYIRQACEYMQQSGVVEIKNQIFVHPTPGGERIISELTGCAPVAASPPAFPTDLLGSETRL